MCVMGKALAPPAWRMGLEGSQYPLGHGCSGPKVAWGHRLHFDSHSQAPQPDAGETWVSAIPFPLVYLASSGEEASPEPAVGLRSCKPSEMVGISVSVPGQLGGGDRTFIPNYLYRV